VLLVRIFADSLTPHPGHIIIPGASGRKPTSCQTLVLVPVLEAGPARFLHTAQHSTARHAAIVLHNMHKY
jgi:hypothetical protein